MNEKPFQKMMYFALALDPVHVGTGGFRLGCVDNTIVRDIGTGIPKIPGSSLAGVSRAYTAMAVQSENDTEIENFKINYDKYMKWKYRRPLYKFQKYNGQVNIENGFATVQKNTDGKYLYESVSDNNTPGTSPVFQSCAGKGGDHGEDHCGKNDCPVCIPYGYSKGEAGDSFQGLARFCDAMVLLFPVHTLAGPVWITCPSILKIAGINLETSDENGGIDQLENEQFICGKLLHDNDHLNFGWLYLSRCKKETGDCSFSPQLWKIEAGDKNEKKLKDLGFDEKLLERTILLSDTIFSRVVNENLEVRTSVSIDPATGAAENKALFTYEAVPRGTVFFFNITYCNPEYFKIYDPNCTYQKREDIRKNVEKGLKLMAHLGVGGMNTRGMGRIRILNINGENA